MPFDQVNFELPVITKPDTHLADILRAAWKTIERDGWLKAGTHRQGGILSACAVAALARTATVHHDAHLGVRMLERALPPGFTYVPVYNDHPDTTLADMRALFLRAVDLAEGGR